MNHWLLWPVRLYHRLGPVPAGLATIAILMLVLRLFPREVFTMVFYGWIAFMLYVALAPRLARAISRLIRL